ncbi:MAG: NADPH-dependent glutamate synthase [Clostridiales bacterium]|nr:NADPH-dependent glutamate synthase [Clostridiales bacterium]MBQ3020198.1 NADPH-dependent glutamate synthase [Clostridia bacterium]
MAPKFNMNPLKNPMPAQDPEIRNGNFEEVALGYTAEMAIDEAKRCIGCKNRPCVAACPVNIKIPEFIAKVAEGDFEAAYQIIAEDSSLPAVCGRVCPQETQCEGKCTRGIKAGCEAVGIGRLERFVADWHNANCDVQPVPAPSNGHKVAVVGSGPAGLTCAGDLAKMGYDVTVFEALHVAGGVLVYGIPEFRLPKSIVQKEVDNLKALGVKVETNMVIGRVITIEELKSEYGFEAIFIGSGAGLPKFMNIPGESLKGVYSANEFLTRSNLMKAYKPDSHTPIQHGKCVAVVGGGNVAMDAARTAKRLGAEVHIVYRRGEEELPARREEIEHAKEEGIIFDLLTNPTRILATPTDNPRDPSYGWVNGIECIRMELGEPDESGRRSPKAVQGSEFIIPVDCVIMSLGTSPNPLLKATTPGLETLRRGEIAVDEVGKTSIEGVYCGGDAATGAATVIKAMGAGKIAAKAMDEYIRSK